MTEGKCGSSRDDGASLKLHGNSGSVCTFQSVNGKDVTFNMKCLWRFCWAAGSNIIITQRAQYLSHTSEPPRVGSKTLNGFFKKMEGCTLMRDKRDHITDHTLVSLFYSHSWRFLWGNKPRGVQFITPHPDSGFFFLFFTLLLICNMRVFRNNRSVSQLILNSMHVFLLGQGESLRTIAVQVK